MAHTLSDTLRNETSSLHEALDQSPLLGKLTKPGLAAADYQKIVESLYRSFARVEHIALHVLGNRASSTFGYDSRLTFLKQDLDQLKSKQGTSVSTEVSNTLATEASAIGMIYVLHGSSLGGKFIMKKLETVLPKDCLHFYGASEGFFKSWAIFKEALDQQDARVASEVVAGANFAFQVFREEFSRAEVSA